MKIAVFCGSSIGENPEFAQATRALGHYLATNGVDLVYGGGNVGLMGVVADAFLEKGARVYGVIPEYLKDRELAHHGLTEEEKNTALKQILDNALTGGGVTDVFALCGLGKIEIWNEEKVQQQTEIPRDRQGSSGGGPARRRITCDRLMTRLLTPSCDNAMTWAVTPWWTSSLSDLRLIYCAGGKTAHISRLFRCIEPLCASKSRKSALAFPPCSRRLLKSDRLLERDNQKGTL
jgi:hypothetical protein